MLPEQTREVIANVNYIMTREADAKQFVKDRAAVVKGMILLTIQHISSKLKDLEINTCWSSFNTKKSAN